MCLFGASTYKNMKQSERERERAKKEPIRCSKKVNWHDFITIYESNISKKP